MKKIKDRYNTVIIGAGPAGLAAAVRLSEKGMNDFLLIERDGETGGILNQCIHNGFGLRFFREDLTGPEFARRLETQLPVSADVLTGAMVSSADACPEGGFSIKIRSRRLGLLVIKADTIITATGCRERTRENIEVPGTRPAGVFTAGQAQALINRHHYSIGRRVVIQGSGDIGLIMARRLILEGFDVLAVFERLPYLSGSIRNKVQCLDHFGIPLLLGRRISEIKGRGRVSGVDTTGVDENFHNVPGSTESFNCDTVLFAAGLIPELEAVKPAGLELSDRFHPEVNSAFETNVPGLFAAGNCLHINDLADSAAEEGIKTADSVLNYFEDADRFRTETAADLPYSEPEPQTALNNVYFEKIKRENLTVCIVCPAGCLLREGEFGCKRGEEYFRRTAGPAGDFSQRIHTTVECGGKVIPAVSDKEVSVKIAQEAIRLLKEATRKADEFKSSIEVDAGGSPVVFKLCRAEAQ